jgi:hypothetical protein
MPALDFPANPTNGQQYGNWVYSTSKGAWQAKPLTSAVATPSDTAPLNPDNGDLWYNTNDGNTYVYYVDGTSNQWVQLKSDATLSSTLGTRVTTLESFPTGLVDLVPSSVSVGSGSASVNSSGMVTFTGVSSLTVNSLFSSAYRDYRIVASLAQSNEAEIRLRYAAAGTPTATNYYYGAGRTAGNVFDNYSSTNGAYQVIGLGSSGGGTSISVDIYRPAINQTTGATFISGGLASGYGLSLWGGGNNQNTTVFDGVQIYPGAGTMTGTLQVYGYR